MSRPWARLRQVLYYVFARPTGQDLRVAARRLPAELFELYRQMRPQDQAHGARVADRLAARGAPDPVVAAGYLHDAGKPGGYGLFWRCAMVLFPGEPPAEADAAKGKLAWARRIYHHHARDAARAVAARGGWAELQALIVGDPGAPWLAEFERADDEG